MDPLKILCLHRQNTAVGYYRTRVRARMLKALGHEVKWSEEKPYYEFLRDKKKGKVKKWAEEWFMNHLGEFDILMVDRALTNEEWGVLAGYRHYSRGCRMIVDFDDDFRNVPEWNPAQIKFQPGQEFHEAGLNHLKVAEMVTVSTPALAKEFKEDCHAVRVVPNLLDPEDWANWPADPRREHDPHLRVLYGGASGHFGDMDMAREGLEAMLRKQLVPWRLICFGAVPAWIHEVKLEMPGKVVVLPWTTFRDYPQVIAWGGFDLAIAPLAEHAFNKSKSNIKWLEAGIQGIPFLCSKVGPYAKIPAGAAIRVENTPAQWADGLRGLLTNEALRKSLKEKAYQVIRSSWTLDSGGENLQILLEETMSRPRIEGLEDSILPKDREELLS